MINTGDGIKDRIIVCGGFSLCLLIGTFTLWGGLSLSTLTGFHISDILKYWSTPSLLAVGVALFSIIFRKGIPSARTVRIATAASGVFIFAGYGILFFLGTSEEFSIPFTILAAGFIGFGYGVLLLLWQHHLSHFAQDEVTKILLASLIVSSILYLLLFLILKANMSAFFPLIVAGSIILSFASAKIPQGSKEELCPLDSKRGIIRTIFSDLRDPLLCVSAIAVAVVLTRAIAMDGIKNADTVNIASSVSIIAVSGVLYLMWFVFGKKFNLFGKQNIQAIYRLFFPLIATALVALSIFGNVLALPVTTLVYAAFSIVSALMMSTSISIARKYKMWSPYVFGIFAGCMYLVFTAATVLGAWVYYPKNFGAATFSIVVLVVLYTLAMSYFAIQNRRKKGGEEEASGKTDNSPVAQEPQVIDEVAQRCGILSEQRQITAREKEIFLLIARGRDVPSIAKQLFISENTVRSHSKNVYRKLGIHSKQELLDLLETVSLD